MNGESDQPAAVLIGVGAGEFEDEDEPEQPINHTGNANRASPIPAVRIFEATPDVSNGMAFLSFA